MLSRDTISIGGDYTLRDPLGATVMTFDGKLRFGAVFTAMDGQGRALFTGREHILNLDQRFEFERDGVAYATMQAGDRLETSGDVRSKWALRRGDATVARVQTDDYVHTVDLVDSHDAAFVMSVVMAVARLNTPSNVGSPAD